MHQQASGNDRNKDSAALKVQKEKPQNRQSNRNQKAPIPNPQTGTADLVKHFHGNGEPLA
jgi:hypothetical protein